MIKQKLLLLGAACICSLSFMSQSATAALMFNADVTPEVIFGSGNINGSFTVDQNNGVELGLRGKLRHNAAGAPENTFNSPNPGDGTYSFDAGVAPTQSSPTAVWSFEWSINSNWECATTGVQCRNLNDLTYLLGIDSDAGAGQDWATFDPINGPNPDAFGFVVWDHAIGDNDTVNGGGTSATSVADYASLIGTNNVAQNSWKAHWFLDSSFDPTVDGQYDFFLEAYNGSSLLARTDMSIIVGTGATVPPVPVPAAIWLFGTAMIGLVGFGKRRKTAS